ncbi:TonB family protein [Mucilaginibacter gracilis]|uniref:TonB family protein n=1 Tax=Mucilaginibacter gracilis TaxID=423350 RepID=A0A495J8T2_9SPHI|nr:energy transducer TonB [Mucilaginibacter gracilis]RKR85405.1 TonB family protein [Mucilaginibacter gracilis]
MEYREQNNYPKAFALTAIIMGALVALCFLLTFTIPAKPIEGTGGILVNYGTTDKGMGDDYMSAEEISRAEKANKTAPNKVTPTQNSEKASNDVGDKKVVTQTTEDAPVVADNSKKATNTIATTDTKKAQSKPVINQNALYKGAKTTGTGAGDGNTNTPGNQGKVNGSTLSDNYNGTGSGNGGLTMGQRSFVTRPTVDNPKRTAGIVKVDVKVDKNGNVTEASVGRGTTVAGDNTLLQKCVQAVYGAKVNASELAPDTQTGTVTFVFKVN